MHSLGAFASFVLCFVFGWLTCWRAHGVTLVVRRRQSRKNERDENEAAFAAKQRVIALTEGEDAGEPVTSAKVLPMRHRKNPAAVALGRRGGRKSAQARMEQISPEERSRIASHAARVRWKKVSGPQ